MGNERLTTVRGLLVGALLTLTLWLVITGWVIALLFWQ
jgi:hypothetical protein